MREGASTPCDVAPRTSRRSAATLARMRSLSVVLSAALLVALAAAPASAAPVKSKRSPSEIASYWTDARMRDAKPRERAKPGGGAGGGGRTTDWTGAAVPTTDGRYVGEYAKNGKLFFTIAGSRYVCSATAVAGKTTEANLIWTAGHCVTDGEGPDGVDRKAEDILFVPGYLNGAEPYGRWAGTLSDATDGWEDSGGEDFRFDTGAVRVVRMDPAPSAPGGYVANGSATLAATVGTRPISFTPLVAGTKVASYGYPAAQKFSGQVQRSCASTVRGPDRYTAGTPTPVQIGCDMTGGSSGGGWILDNAGGVSNGRADADEPLVSVNSYGYSFEKNTMYGPQLTGGQAAALYDRMG